MLSIFEQVRNFFKLFFENKSLAYTLTKRDILQRYQGSYLGVIWSLLTPVVMLVIYTFIFSVVFQARWGINTDKYEFSMLLFSGLIIFNFFSDVVSRSPGIIVSHANYVTKVIFPVEILPLVITFSALFQLILSFVIWFVFYSILIGLPPITVFFAPLVFVPLVVVTLGIAYFLASIGVYLRDIGQFVQLIISALMFLSPIFYPITVFPEEYRWLMFINPITIVIEAFRDVAILNNFTYLVPFAFFSIFSIFIFIVGYIWFIKTKKGFSDVL